MTEKEKLIDFIKNPEKYITINGWYNAQYAITQTFSVEEIQSMTDKEVDNLIRLANEIQLSLY